MAANNDEPCCKPMFWAYLVACVALVTFAGLMSGLTLGLMTLTQVDLEVLVKAGQPQDRKNAAKLLPVMKNQQLLLCTLLICNFLAMEALPIFLDALVPAWGAILISVTLILAFGQIIPHAVCSRYGLSVGAKMVVVVRVLLLVFFPISYPISKLLDWVLGKEHLVLLRRAELKILVAMHGNEAGKGGELTSDETTIITGALELTQKSAKDAMTLISETFSLDINSKLDMDTLGLIMTKGHSRVPIYSGSSTNIIGFILVKNLIICRPEDETPIRDVTIRKIPRVNDKMPLYEILNEFQEGHSHMAVVVKDRKDVKATVENSKGKPGVTNTSIMKQGKDARPQLKKRERWDENILYIHTDLPSYSSDEEVIGIITMEDVIEELLQEDILDETDENVGVHHKIGINLPPSRSSTRSLGTTSVTLSQLQTPEASPLSSYHHSPILRSPISPFIQSPFLRPTLSNSPRKSSPNSRAKLTGLGRNSQASHQVTRKLYEKLRKFDGT